jgi:hypothetical protein
MTLEIVFAVLKRIWPYLVAAGLVVAAVIWYNVQIHAAEKRGAAGVQAKWDEDKAARIKLTTGIALLYAKALTDGEQHAKDQQQQDDTRYAALEQRIAALPQVRTVYLSSSTVGLFDDITAGANGATTAPVVPATGTAPVSASAQGQSDQGRWVSEAELAQYSKDAARAYEDAKSLFHQCIDWYNQVRQPTLKGAL